MDKCAITMTADDDWWLERVTMDGQQRYPERIRVGSLERPLVYVPERTCRMEYDAVHCDCVCTACGERYESDLYVAVTDDDRTILRPMRYCPSCGARVVKEEA